MKFNFFLIFIPSLITISDLDDEMEEILDLVAILTDTKASITEDLVSKNLPNSSSTTFRNVSLPRYTTTEKKYIISAYWVEGYFASKIGKNYPTSLVDHGSLEMKSRMQVRS